MSRHSRRTLTLLAVPALAIGTMTAVAQTAAPSAPAADAAAPAVSTEAPRVHRARAGKRGGGLRGMRGMLMQNAFRDADADGDGSVTQAEVDDFLAAQLTEADADTNGTISLEEFQAIYLQRTRSVMVDAFQSLDEDGDGQITTAEVSARFGDIVERMDRNGDDALSREDRRGRGDRGRRGRGRDRGGDRR